MPPEPNMQVRFVMRDAARYDATGQVRLITEVVYFVGPHGPFTENIPKGEATPERIRSLIDSRVAGLRQLFTTFPPPAEPGG